RVVPPRNDVPGTPGAGGGGWFGVGDRFGSRRLRGTLRHPTVGWPRGSRRIDGRLGEHRLGRSQLAADPPTGWRTPRPGSSRPAPGPASGSGGQRRLLGDRLGGGRGGPLFRTDFRRRSRRFHDLARGQPVVALARRRATSRLLL